LASEGFNRTVTIDGLCEEGFSATTSFQCEQSAGAFKAGLTAAAAAGKHVNLRFGAASCPLTGISVYKKKKAAPFEAEMRFEFEGCTGAPVSSAAITVGIRKDPVGDFNLYPWAKEVCKTSTTTAAPVATISSETESKMMLVGKGRCDGSVRNEIEKIDSALDCKLQCVSSQTKAHLLGGIGCTGFSFNAQASGATCITYSGEVQQVQTVTHPDWQCYNMTFNATSAAKSTPAPVVAPKELTQMLYLKEVLGASSTAHMQQIAPPALALTCFKPLWWFSLQDRAGHALSVPVKEADWDDFLARIPTEVVSTNHVTSPVVLDRVIVDTCTASNGWGRQACFVAPVEAKTACRQEELTGSIVSGVITSLLTWLFVGLVFTLYKNALRTEYKLLDPGNEGAFCQKRIVHALCVAAAGGACLCCWLSMQFLDAIMRSADCFDFSEYLVVILAVVLSVALTIIIILWYMATVHPAHPHPLLGHDAPPPTASTKLMLVEVEDGKQVGQPLDSMVATQQGNVFTSFRSSGSGNSPNASFMASGASYNASQLR
jgi:hypothetical protein